MCWEMCVYISCLSPGDMVLSSVYINLSYKTSKESSTVTLRRVTLRRPFLETCFYLCNQEVVLTYLSVDYDFSFRQMAIVHLSIFPFWGFIVRVWKCKVAVNMSTLIEPISEKSWAEPNGGSLSWMASSDWNRMSNKLNSKIILIFFQPINGTKIKLLLISFTNDEISDIRNADVNLVETIIFGDYLT